MNFLHPTRSRKRCAQNASRPALPLAAFAGAGPCNEPEKISRRLRFALPLPGGEGRGEGEHNTDSFGLHPKASFWASTCAALLACAAAHSQPLTFTTLAGFPGQGSSNALFFLPAATAADAAGNIYVADTGNNTIRKITPAGIVSTVAGSAGISGSTNGFGTNALFNQPGGIAVDSSTNLYVADSGNNTLRLITPSGMVSTYAGASGIAGSSNGQGTNAQFFQPQGLAIDSSGNLYVADYGNDTIRKIAPGGIVSTLAGFPGNFGSTNSTGTNAQFYQPEALAVDNSSNVYVADTANATVRKITALGVVTTLAGSAGNYGANNAMGTNATFYQPDGIALDSATNVYVAEFFNHTIRKITTAGIVSTFAGSIGISGGADGTNGTARFWGPQGLATDGSGNLYVADSLNGTIRKISSAGIVTTFAGSPSTGTADGTNGAARFNLPLSGAVDSSGNLYVADSLNHTIREITPAGQVTTFAGSPGKSGSKDAVGTNALFYAPQAVAIDASDNLYVADTQNGTIRLITPEGVVTTLAGSPGNFNSFDGTNSAAQFFLPSGIAVDSSTNIYVADTLNHTIRLVTPAGVVTTFAGLDGNYGSADGTNSSARFNRPKGLAVDNSGNLYVADYFNQTIRQITPAGQSSTLAGLAGVSGSADGTNSDARFFEPESLVVDSGGNIYVADSGNQTIRKIAPIGTNWIVTTVGGTAGVKGNADGSAAQFNFPAGIALDSAGYLYVADSANNTIRQSANVPLPLVITNLAVIARPRGAIITWSTAPNATAQVLYGPTPAYGISSALNTNLQSTQGVLLTGLQTNTLYYFQVVSTFGASSGTATGTFSTDLNIIMQSSQALYTGVWVNDSTPTDNYSSTYKIATVTNGPDSADATFDPAIPLAAQYDVYLWYSEGANRSSFAPVLATYNGGSFSTTFNETVPGGKWQLITPNQPFAAGTNAFVRLGNGTGETGNKVVVADAVQWAYTLSQDLPVNGNLPAWWLNFYLGTTNVSSASPGANGYSLLDDYILGISPNDPNTFLNLNIIPAASGFQATFSPWFGDRLYQLQSATNISNPIWTNLPNLTVTQTNGIGFIACTNTSFTPTYYRLSVQLLP